jgi:hypothetical protein
MSEIKIFKNPTDHVIEFMYDHKINIFQPGEVKPLDEFISKYLSQDYTKSGLIEIKISESNITTENEIVNPTASSEVTEPKNDVEILKNDQNLTPATPKIENQFREEGLKSMTMGQLIGLAKNKGWKIGMTKAKIIELLTNGQ